MIDGRLEVGIVRTQAVVTRLVEFHPHLRDAAGRQVDLGRRRLRAAPGRFGLVSANGNYLTKHSWGVYSTAPVIGLLV